jgi:hypothetical protein
MDYHGGAHMPTNLAIDDCLLEAVTAALEEYIRRRKQQEILSLFGKVDYAPGYDYKRERKGKQTRRS